MAQAALQGLTDIYEEGGGLPVTKELVGLLLARLGELNDWSQCLVLELLARYAPSPEEVIGALNLLDSRLRDHNQAVVLGVVRVYLLFTRNNDKLRHQVYQRVRGRSSLPHCQPRSSRSWKVPRPQSSPTPQ